MWLYSRPDHKQKLRTSKGLSGMRQLQNQSTCTTAETLARGLGGLARTGLRHSFPRSGIKALGG